MWPRLRIILLRALRVIGLLVFFGWSIFQAATTWIGRATTPEDTAVAKDRLGQFVDWLVTTPAWVPATLAIAFGFVVLFPGFFWTVLQAIRGKTKATAPEVEEKRKQLEPAAVLTASAPPSQEVDEGTKKNAAKEMLVHATRRFLYPATTALVPFYARARDIATREFPSGPAKAGIVRGLDHALGETSSATKISIHELQNPDIVANRTLHDVVSNYYYNYCNYVRGIQLTYDLIKFINPHAGFRAKLRADYDPWRAAHEALAAENSRLANEEIHLDLLRTMQEQAGLEVPIIDWESDSLNL